MIGKFLLTLAAYAGVALALGYGASGSAAQESYSLKRVYKAGETDRYKTVITMEAEGPMGPFTFEFTILTTEKVKDVKPDGSAVVETTVESGKLKAKDVERELNDSSTFTTTIDKTGKETRSEAGEPTAGKSQRGPAVMMLGLARAAMIPPRTLKVGEEWKYDIPATDAKSSKTTGSVTLVGLVGVERKTEAIPADALKVKCVTVVTSPGPMGDTRLQITSTVLLDPANGKSLDIQGDGSGRLGPLDAKKITIRQQHLAAGAKLGAKTASDK